MAGLSLRDRFFAWVARVLKGSRPERIDPFTLSEPWRHYVQDAIQARTRFHDTVRDARPGPTQDRLAEIEARVSTGVDEVWRIARRGDDLVDARGRLDPADIRRRIDNTGGNEGETAARTLEALRAQLSTAERLEGVIADADSRLRLLNARLDEAAARTIELSVQTGGGDLSGLGSDVDSMVDELEALRQAIEEIGGGTAVAGSE